MGSRKRSPRSRTRLRSFRRRSTPPSRCTPTPAPASAFRMISRMKKARTRSAVLLLLLVCAPGCAPSESGVVRDDVSRPVDVPPHVARIVTLAPNLTEMVYAIGAGNRIVGTDDFSDEPASVKALPKVGGMQPNIEKIVALKPDLVLATTNGNHPNLSPALAAVHIPL